MKKRGFFSSINAKKKYFYIVILSLSFFAGYFNHILEDNNSVSFSPGFRNIATIPKKPILYTKLDCPSEKEYSSFVKKISFVGKLEGGICDKNSDKTKFGKLLQYLSILKINLPLKWRGGANLALKNTMSYLRRLSQKIDIDFSQNNSVAYNRNKGDIYLGTRFFSKDPLDALLILVHEARHSSAKAKGHTRCLAGHLSQSLKACDDWFTRSANAGAYSYTVSFAFGMAKFGKNLLNADREFLIADGLASLGRHFVSVPAWLGLPFETVVALNKKNQLFYIHPILETPIEYDYGKKMDIKRIKFNRGRDGLFLFTNQGYVFEAKPFSKIKNSIAKNMNIDVSIKDLEYLTWYEPNIKGTKTKLYILDENNHISALVFDFKKRELFFKESSFQMNGVDFVQLVHAQGLSRFILTSDGELGFFNSDSSENYIAKSLFQDPLARGWTHIDGGFFHSEVFGVNEDGELHYWEQDKVKKSSFQVHQSMLYHELSNFRMQLNKEGKVFMRRYAEESSHEIDLKNLGIKVKSIAYIRSFLPSQIFGVDNPINESIKKICQLTIKSSIDPWTNMAMGINSSNRLSFQTSKNSCQEYELVRGVKNYEFSGDEVKKHGDFSKLYLKVTFLNGKVRNLYPYSGIRR